MTKKLFTPQSFMPNINMVFVFICCQQSVNQSTLSTMIAYCYCSQKKIVIHDEMFTELELSDVSDIVNHSESDSDSDSDNYDDKTKRCAHYRIVKVIVRMTIMIFIFWNITWVKTNKPSTLVLLLKTQG